jgi:2-acylglycerol O-acyltransferase 2
MSADPKDAPAKLNRTIESKVPCGPILANLIMAGSWVLSPTCSFGACILCAKDFGVVGVLTGIVLGVGICASPRSYPIRGGITALLCGLAYQGGSTEARAAALFFPVLVFLITHRRFPSSPAFIKLINETLGASQYYARMEMRGAIDKIKPGKFFYAVHPHGCLSAGFTWNHFMNEAFHDKVERICFFVDGNLRERAPFFRPIVDMWTNEKRTAVPADKKSIRKALEKGDAVCIIPGGFEDATLFQYGKERTAMKKRKGIVKYCLEYGYAIVPSYTFGEAETYVTFTGFLKFRLWLNKYGVPAVAFVGNPFAPFLPRTDAPILSYVGPPLELPHISTPTEQDIDHWHGKYLQALEELFDRHKAEAGKPHAKLEIF